MELIARGLQPLWLVRGSTCDFLDAGYGKVHGFRRSLTAFADALHRNQGLSMSADIRADGIL